MSMFGKKQPTKTKGNAKDAPPPEPTPPPAQAATEEAEAPPDLATVTQRVAKMQNKLLQDSSSLLTHTTAISQALAQMVPWLQQELEKLHTTNAMLARNAAVTQVKSDEAQLETRRLFSQSFDGVVDKLRGELTDMVVERVLLGAVADAVNAADAVLHAAKPEERSAPAFDALRMVRQKLLGGFVPLGVEAIDPALGTQFDEQVHEAAGVDVASDAAEGCVTDVYALGYKLRGRVVRRAKVVVKGAKAS